MIQSPLNYTGGKYRLLQQILPYFPEKINTFVDLFCGGCNVGINTIANRNIYNDRCKQLIRLYDVMQRVGSKAFIDSVENIIRQYDLSDVKRMGYKYYNCTSSDGLSSYNREKYYRLRADFNELAIHNDEYYIRLYVLIVFSFNNQIRFNRENKFNLPPGKRDFNKKISTKVKDFIDALHQQNSTFLNMDFRDFNYGDLQEGDFVYADPPYLITCATYNEQNGWSEEDECSLLKILDMLNERHIKFALSNVLQSKGRENPILSEWIHNHPSYRMINLNYNYNNASYHRKNKVETTREILIINY